MRAAATSRVPYIHRRVATYDILGCFREAGADVDGERVHFEPGMCRQIIQASAPRQYTQHACNPANNVEIGGDNTVLSPVYGPPFVHDRNY